MSAQTKSHSWSWRWAALGLVIVAAVVIAILAFNGSKRQEAGEPSAPPTPSPSSTVDDQPDALPIGCLGGPNRDAAMLLTAINDAPHSAHGAVDAAASFVRWIQRYPYPSEAEAKDVSADVLAAESFTDNLVQYLKDEPDLSGAIVAPHDEYWMSTVPGVWHLESESIDDVTVTIGTGFVLDGGLSPMLRSSITVTLRWEGGHWRIADADGTRTTEDLFAIGRPFTGGC